MMKSIVMTILFTSFIFLVEAQKYDTIPTQKDAFLKELDKRFDATKRSELKELSKEMSFKIEKGEFSDKLLNQFIENTNEMIQSRISIYPYISDLTKFYLRFNELNLSTEKINNFQTVFAEVIEKSKKTDKKNIIDFIDFALPLYSKNALYHSKAKDWITSSENFTLKYDDVVKVEVPLSDIKAYTSSDTLIINNTKGIYNWENNTWYGEKGAVNWEKAGLPKDEVFATFDEYQINMNTQSYFVEKVVFTYKNYFSRTLIGTLEDKLMSNPSGTSIQYPRFTAELESVPPQKIQENITFYGGFTLKGSKISSDNEDENSVLEISKPNSNQLVLRAISPSVTINKPEKISTSNSKVSIFFDDDSIYHPSVSLIYNLQENKLRLVKGEGALAQSKFTDSYHKIDFDADILEWDMSKDFIDINTISTSGIKAAVYESDQFFSEQKLKKIKGAVSYDPLSILNRYRARYQYNEIPAAEFAKSISPLLTVQQTKPLLYKLIQEGFIRFDERSEIITILDKVKHYVEANGKVKDYDNIYFQSKSKQQNGRINLADKTIEVQGVNSVPISNANTTVFFPDSLQITLKEDRDMEFDGLLFCGRMDFFGKGHQFEYDSFNILLPQIDTLILNIPDGDKVDQYGKQMTRPLNSTLENLTGNLNIDIPINKSGRADLAQFPIFESTSKSKIFYDNQSIRNGAYNRDNFFFELEPFTIDSLKYLQPSNLHLEGKLYSAGIFPDITEPVRVQSDLSLGFNIDAPEDGFDIYGGKGKFFSAISLNNDGLSGQGVIQYQTTSFESKNIEFYPDSLMAMTDTLGVRESRGTYKSPWVKSAKNDIKWYPYQDSMIAASDNINPFRMYDERILLDGELIITDKGISGSGIADWDDAQLISNRFVFEADEILADTAELKIKTIDGDKVTFNTPNVNAHVDFKENTGFFKSNTNENKTEFSYNQYFTTIDEFFWDIDNKKLEFSVPEGEIGAPFSSLHPDQDSLSFLSPKADYSLETSIIEAHGVPEILVADSRVIPGDGEVVIKPNAEMQPLSNATIEASAESKRHIIKKVTATIKGRNDMIASGEYKYQAKETEPQFIQFSSIDVVLADSSLLDKKKKEVSHILRATGSIGQADDFIIYPKVNFYGDIEMYSSLDNLKINGYTKINFENDYVASDFFELETEVDPQNLTMDIEGAKDPQGKQIRTGVFVSKAGLEPIYTNILNSEVGPIDVPMIETNKSLLHDYETNTYSFGDKEKNQNIDLIKKGNILQFQPDNNKVYAQGSLDLGLDFKVIDEKVAGSVNSNFEDNAYLFNTTIAFPFDWDNDLIDRISYYLFEDNFDRYEIDYSDNELLKHWAEFLSEKTMKKVEEEIFTTGYFERPKELKESVIFTNVNLYYDPLERVYRSDGDFGLAFVGDRAIHKEIDGWLEFGHRLGSDYFNMYLETSLGDWLFITYNGIEVEIASSYDDIIGAINAVDGNKRKVKGENNVFYIYKAGSEIKAKRFKQRMKAIEENTDE